jgi:hypothetical protein
VVDIRKAGGIEEAQHGRGVRAPCRPFGQALQNAVPAAEKITTRMISTTPVLIELSVFQVLRAAEPIERAITFFFLTW